MPAVEVFYSYSREDEPLRKELEDHLLSLRQEGVISSWHDHKINAGEEWSADIYRHLESASVILLLISPDFLASDYIFNVELKTAIDLHQAGEVRVIPIILQSCNWRRTPFQELPVLPEGAKPITEWRNRGEAFEDIAKGIRKAINDLFKNQQSGRNYVYASPSEEELPREEVSKAGGDPKTKSLRDFTKESVFIPVKEFISLVEEESSTNELNETSKPRYE